MTTAEIAVLAVQVLPQVGALVYYAQRVNRKVENHETRLTVLEVKHSECRTCK